MTTSQPATSKILTVGVIGAGTMGRGIAQAAALGGYTVVVYDVEEAVLSGAVAHIQAAIDKGVALGKTETAVAERAKQSTTTTTELADVAQADLIIEAAPEKMALKRDIFAALADLAPPKTIFASNTSSLSISALAAATDRPEQFLGLHFFNPAHIMKLVEVIRGDDTSEATVATALAAVDQMGKTAVLCQDTPAFIVNRVARPFYGEALRLLGEGAADPETIDRLLTSLGFRMGPFALIDLIGADINLTVTQSVYDAFYQDPKYRPHPIQRRMVESGRLGRKTGRGFYDYTDD